MKNITRLDYERSQGWWVRLHQGSTAVISKLFSDSRYGGAKSALKAAQKYRKQQLKLYPEFTMERRGRRKANTPPPKGRVWRHKIQRRAALHDVYSAYIKWGPGIGQHASTSWSIKVWGPHEAKRQCYAWLSYWELEQTRFYKVADTLRPPDAVVSDVARFEDGWRVHISDDTYHVSRIFRDQKCGSRAKARDVALNFVEGWKAAKKARVRGCTLTKTLYWTGTRYEWVWAASWKGQVFRRRVRHHGDAGARKLCLDWCKS